MQKFLTAALSAALAGIAAVASAQSVPSDLRLATLEELMNIQVTSVSKREQRAEDVPAALFVISRDDIRRSGRTSIPELLRLVPGVQVSQINANKWSVSVRGFNTLGGNKLLVMVDGRSIYNPAYATVLWDTEDLMLADVERIEVVRGPGGAMWGSNAVNGVINIITRSSADTQGGFARIGVGTFDTTDVGVRYGGGMAAWTYRVFAQGATHGASQLVQGGSADDAWHAVTSGFRSDWAGENRSLMLQGGVTAGRQRPLWLDPTQTLPTLSTQPVSHTRVGNLLARWTQTGPRGTLQVQGYFDGNHRDEAIGGYSRRTWDADVQFTAVATGGHALVAGGGFRHLSETIEGRGTYRFTPDRMQPDIINGFMQDAITLGRRVELTLGAKWERHSVFGSSFQPSARMMWKLADEQRLWTSVARAVRLPSLIERGLRIEFAPIPIGPGLVATPGLTGNPDFRSERLDNVEAGYRAQIARRGTLDVVVFRGTYDYLMSQEPPTSPSIEMLNGVPQLTLFGRYENLRAATTTGGELVGRVQLAGDWEADAGLALFHQRAFANGSLDPDSVHEDGNLPALRWQLRSAFPLGRRGRGDLLYQRVGRLEAANVPAYNRADANLEWKISEPLAVTVNGRNLLGPGFVDAPSFARALVTTRIPRNISAGLTWRF